jgi:phospholipase C
VDNFRDRKLHGKPEGEDGCIPSDVLGYYEKNDAENVNDLPVFAFLAEKYAYCDRYFCSHPGPTLPNRMYSLTGDVQYDRLGVPILDNNHGDNFLLSRAETIYDLLTRKSVSWRVYESNPSVTMLRMFARYATDDVNIRPITELAGDVLLGNIPSLTVVEPAMHHHPEDDDHPDADMYRGQIFIRGVYEALRANPDVWRKTLLLITYDEHGGFYDHVIPPIADVLSAPAPSLVSDGSVGGLTDGGGGGGGGGGGTVVGGHGHGHLHILPELISVVLGDPGLTDATPTDATIQIPYGVRVPTFVVSPWVTPGKGPGVTLDHCSILKTVLARFCGDEKPFLNDRVRASQSFESYLREVQPRTDVGAPPVLGQLPITARRLVSGASAIITPPLFRKQMREENVDYHDISGRLARMLGR